MCEDVSSSESSDEREKLRHAYQVQLNNTVNVPVIARGWFYHCQRCFMPTARNLCLIVFSRNDYDHYNQRLCKYCTHILYKVYHCSVFKENTITLFVRRRKNTLKRTTDM